MSAFLRVRKGAYFLTSNGYGYGRLGVAVAASDLLRFR